MDKKVLLEMLEQEHQYRLKVFYEQARESVYNLAREKEKKANGKYYA